MSDQPTTRTFDCPHCATGIQIPYDLPPTSASCPKCGMKVTSPALPAKAPVLEREVLADDVVPSPSVSESGAIQTPPSETIEPQSNATAGRGKLLVAACAAIALIILAAAAWKVLSRPDSGPSEEQIQAERAAEKRRDRAYRNQGWIADAEAVLEEFLQAKTVPERAALTLRGVRNEGEMMAVYEEFAGEEYHTPASLYSPVSLADGDTERGIFLMTYSRPEQFAIRSFFRPLSSLRVKYGLEAPDQMLKSEAALSNFLDRSLKVMAFFRRTPEGMKLDWQTYAQTKFRLLRHFVDHPEPGRKGTFRVAVREDIDLNQRDRAGFSVFRLSDPANHEDFAKILVEDESELGRAFSSLRWRDRVVSRLPTRNATVSLQWTAGSEPKLEMGELICWEFLGLGGVRGNEKEVSQEAP